MLAIPSKYRKTEEMQKDIQVSMFVPITSKRLAFMELPAGLAPWVSTDRQQSNNL